MRINLITEEEYFELVNIYQTYPKLSLQNTGWETLDFSKLNSEELENFEIASNIIKKCIWGFSEFNNFRVGNKTGEVLARFQYTYDADQEPPRSSFIGVGYIKLEEMFKGFKIE